jgi:hypothetical protein
VSTIHECESLVDGLIADYQAPRVKLDRGNGEFRLRTLLKMAKWAEAQQPAQVGDVVHLHYQRCTGIEQGNGWRPYREQLANGPHEVVGLGFNGAHDYWHVEIKIDGRLFMVPTTWIDSVIARANPPVSEITS